MKTFENLTIEKVKRADLDQLEKLFATAFADEVDLQQIKRRIRRARQFYFILQPLSRFSVWVKNHFNVYVIKVAAEVVGFIQLSYLNALQIHIDYIAFSKPYRGRGLGRWVLTKLIDEVADDKSYDTVLEVRTDNPAYHFYRRLGFKAVTEILHYERAVDNPAAITADSDLAGFRELRAEDRSQLYRLYKASVSHNLRQVIKRGYGEFNPSMMVRHLDWVKNYLMRKHKFDYVVEQGGKIVALLTINSYFKAKNYVISLILSQSAEYLRPAILDKAVALIKSRHQQGIISITIYSDDCRKQRVLEKLGFRQESAYYLMFRPADKSFAQPSINRKYRVHSESRNKKI
ncbi:MAG: rimI: ribosomal-protein-alanine acetyltransferase [Firmicutes bacterium]|nr:rimI: ribosomal-protein-alanine acetyltransferase [Bacillota bacterium]